MPITILSKKTTGEKGICVRVRKTSRYFSISKYGKDEAMRLAKEAELKLLQLKGIDVRHAGCVGRLVVPWNAVAHLSAADKELLEEKPERTAEMLRPQISG